MPTQRIVLGLAIAIGGATGFIAPASSQEYRGTEQQQANRMPSPRAPQPPPRVRGPQPMQPQAVPSQPRPYDEEEE